MTKVRRTDALARVVTTGAGATVLALICAIAIFLVVEALPALRANQASFLTYRQWFPNSDSPMFGIAALTFGTVMTSGIALLLAAPVAIGLALFLSHYAPRRLAGPLGVGVDLLAAIPSVVFGLWARDYLIGPVSDLSAWLHTYFGWIPLFAGSPQYGRSVLLGAFVLAIMILPIVTALCREVFVQAPRDQIEGALALGASRWETMRLAVLRPSRRGMVAAIMLGLGRALGETIALAVVLGASFDISFHILNPGGNSIAANIANSFAEANETGRGALIASGLVLFLITLLVNGAARLVLRRQERGTR